MDTNTIILLTVSIILFLSGFWFLFRIPKCKSDDIKKINLKISIIIPARNEEHNIGKLLDSINIQEFRPNEIIVVNDGSTDRTKEIGLAKGASVIDSKPLPDGWLGKPWACYQGASAAEGDLLFFIDSDIELEPGGLKKIVDTYLLSSDNSEIAMSIVPFHKVEKPYEELSAFFNIIMAGSMNAFTPIKKTNPTGLFGPTLIVSKENYYKINGHESVKDKILENVFMAEKFRSIGIKLKLFGGKGSISFRMYPAGLKDLTNGWTKAFASGAGRTPFFILLNIILWVSAGFVITIAAIRSLLLDNFILLWAVFYFAYSLQLFWMLKRIGSFRIFSAIFYPVHLLFYTIVFFRSLYYQISGKKIKWKSREVKAER